MNWALSQITRDPTPNVATEPAVEIDEERLVFTRIEAALADQHLRRFGQVAWDGYYALLAALAAQEHLRPR